MKGFKAGLLICLLLCALFTQGCGGGGSGGESASSSSASLSLATDKTTYAAGDIVSATVQLTSATNAPVNGVNVVVDAIYQGTTLASYAANTNTLGKAVLNIPMAMVSSNRTVTLLARSSGITSSNTVNVAVTAPVLASNITASSTGSIAANNTLELVLAADAISFKDGNGNGVAGQTITLTLDSLSGDVANGVFRSSGVIIPTLGSVNKITDATGVANTGVSLQTRAPGTVGQTSVVTFYYTLSTTYMGVTFTKQSSAQFAVTAL